jgi:Membrane protease subunits, stomatin/prohibitin homologs
LVAFADENGNINVKAVVRFITLVGIGLVCLIGGCNSYVQVDQGEAGLLLEMGRFTGTVLEPGPHFKIPFAQNVVNLSTQDVLHEVQTETFTSDLQPVTTKVAINYHLNTEHAGHVYGQYRKDWEKRVIDPSANDAMKAGTALFNLVDAVRHREDVRKHINDNLASKLAPYFTVTSTNIVDFQYSSDFKAAIERKQIAEQDAQTEQNKLAMVRYQAEQDTVRAVALARGIAIQAAAISTQGGADYVALKAIDKWDGQLPQQMIPGAAVPFLNLGGK